MRTLLLDIETAPNVVHVWGLYDQTVAINQIMVSSYVLCWSAKWLDKKHIYFDSVYQSEPLAMLKGIHQLLEEADSVIHFNGTKFDIPTLNKEFIAHEIVQPAPYKQIDLLRVARSQFRFPSNKLDYLCKTLGLGEKKQHKGHDLWVGCMDRDPKSWKVMERYNKHDVVLLEKLYYKIRPWIKGHPNSALLEGKLRCPTCNSVSYHKRGYACTNSYIYQRYQCLACRAWFRGSKSLTKKGEKFIGL